MHRFLTLLQKDLRYFLYLEGLLMLFRVAFLVLFRSQLNAVSASEILYALYLGFRISLKTTVLLVGLPFLLATVPGSFSSRYPEKAVRTLLTGLSLFVMTFLFVARIPYYAIFQETYNIMLFNGMKDDMHAIWDTAVKEYQLFPRLVGVLLLSALVIHLWHRLQERKGIAPQRRVKALLLVRCFSSLFLPSSAALAAAFIPMMESTGKAQPAPNRNSSMKPSSMMDRPCTAPMPPINGRRKKFCAPLRWRKCGRPFGFLAAMGTRRPSMKPLRAPKRRQPASSGPAMSWSS